jgi:hypothetical protein
MKVLKTITAVYVLSLLFMLFSCTDKLFQETEHTKGFLSACISEEGTYPSTTEEIMVRYYDNYSGVEYTEKTGEPDFFSSKNKFLSRIRTGDYRFLAYSQFNDRVRNTSDIETIEIYTDTIYSEKYASMVIVNKQKPVFTASETGMIHREDTTYRTFFLSPMVQQITINVTVEGLTVDHEIFSLEAMLSGVITGRKIYTNQPIPEYAGLIYSFNQTEVANKFTSSAWVFGIANTTPNTFNIECLGNSFKQYFKVDLSSVLEDFTADGMVIDLVISIGENMQMKDIYISAWKDLNQSEIKF